MHRGHKWTWRKQHISSISHLMAHLLNHTMQLTPPKYSLRPSISQQQTSLRLKLDLRLTLDRNIPDSSHSTRLHSIQLDSRLRRRRWRRRSGCVPRQLRLPFRLQRAVRRSIGIAGRLLRMTGREAMVLVRCVMSVASRASI